VTRFISSSLWEVKAIDPATFAAVSLVSLESRSLMSHSHAPRRPGRSDHRPAL